MLDGAARLKDLFAETQRLGMPALAMTDHGNLYGAYDFYKQAVGAGVKPIIGLESYVTPGTSRFERTRVRWADGGENDVSGGGAYTHLTMLAADADGLRNLFRLSSLSSLEGYFYKPRADRELLERYGKWLIASTGCPAPATTRWRSPSRSATTARSSPRATSCRSSRYRTGRPRSRCCARRSGVASTGGSPAGSRTTSVSRPSSSSASSARWASPG